MDLSKAHLFFASRLYCLRGFSFEGQILSLDLDVSNVYFNLPRRMLKISQDVDVRPGDLIRGVSGKTYMVGEHGPAEVFGEVIYKVRKLFEVTHLNATLIRTGMTTDTITGAKKTNSTNTSTIPAIIEFQKQQEDEMRVQSDLVRIIAATPLSVNDKVNEYLVVNVEPQLGLYFATARRA